MPMMSGADSAEMVQGLGLEEVAEPPGTEYANGSRRQVRGC